MIFADLPDLAVGLLTIGQGTGAKPSIKVAARDDGFVFGPSALKPILAIPIQLDFSLTMHGAAMGFAFLFDKLVQLPTVNLLNVVDLIFLVISGCQHAHPVGFHNIPGRSVSGIIPLAGYTVFHFRYERCRWPEKRPI